MSRLAKRPIAMPPATELKLVSGELHIKGPKGTLTKMGHKSVPRVCQEDVKKVIIIQGMRKLSRGVKMVSRGCQDCVKRVSGTC